MASRLRRRAENLRNWIRNNVTHRADIDDANDADNADGPEPVMPYLSYPPIKLDTLETSDTLSPFFGRLPFEVRRRILVYAFGDQTVHMHLRLECIPRRRPYKWEIQPHLRTQFNTTRPHGGLTADMNHGWLWTAFVLAKSDVARGGPRGPRWQWWGCVCHRSMPTGGIGEVQNLSDDKCLVGEADYCDMYGPPEMEPQRCMIGCMGWLLASRQAYAEGIDVVYATNTICIMSNRFLDALLRSVPQPTPGRTLLPPSHLVRITRLEIVWDWALFQDQDPVLVETAGTTETAQRAAFQETLTLLPAAFPRLVALYVAFSAKLYERMSKRAGACLDEIQDVLLMPLDAMMSKLGRLQRHRCFVDMPINTSVAFVERLGCHHVPEVRLLGPQVRPPYTAIRCWWDPSRNLSEQNVQQETNRAKEIEGTNTTNTKDAEDAQANSRLGSG